MKRRRSSIPLWSSALIALFLIVQRTQTLHLGTQANRTTFERMLTRVVISFPNRNGWLVGYQYNNQLLVAQSRVQLQPNYLYYLLTRTDNNNQQIVHARLVQARRH